MKKQNKNCKDCKDCSKYQRVVRPDYYIMGVDQIRTFKYIIPVNSAEGNLPKEYYEYPNEEGEFVTDASNAGYGTGILSGPGFTGGIWETIQEGVDFVTSNPDIAAKPGASGAIIIVNNPNYGLPLQEDPSFLFWDWEPYQTPYESLEDPSWLISFSKCTSKDKGFESYNKWRLKGCGIWKVEWRLRVRPIINLDYYSVTAGDICGDFGFLGSTANYETVKEIMRFYKSLHAQEGSKALGIAPMRIETGIYSHTSTRYNPVVWSDGTYPQAIPNQRRYWSKKYPKEISHISPNWVLGSDKQEPPCERQTWFIGADGESIEINEYYGVPNEEEIIYNYNSSATSNPGRGNFFPQTNDLQTPGSLEFSLTDNIGRSSLIDHINKFNLNGNGTKVAELILEIEGKVNGQWDVSTILIYDVSTITINASTVTIDVNDNLSNPIFENNLGSGYSSSNFYNYDSLDTRYSITLTNFIPSETIPAFNINNVKTQTYTPLTEDFVVELEGFTHVDLDKESDISIYLKVLPEHNDYGSGGIHPMEEDSNNRTAFLQPWYSTVHGNANVFSGPSTSGHWPWAPLSMDFRNGWSEAFDVKYEPLLPVDLERAIVTESNTYLDKKYRREYPMDSFVKGWYIMIEEGWVRAEKVCEDCDC